MLLDGTPRVTYLITRPDTNALSYLQYDHQSFSIWEETVLIYQSYASSPHAKVDLRREGQPLCVQENLYGLSCLLQRT